jgi:hypothetical protein
MKNKMFMIYKSVLEKRLARKQAQLVEIESVMSIGDNVAATEKRKFIETKAIIQELENILDIATSIFETDNDETP